MGAEYDEKGVEDRIIARAIDLTNMLPEGKVHVYDGNHDLPFDALDTMATAIRIMKKRLKIT